MKSEHHTNNNMINLDCMCLKYYNGKLEVLDQTMLPHAEKWLIIDTAEDMYTAIKDLKVRGALGCSVMPLLLRSHVLFTPPNCICEF